MDGTATSRSPSRCFFEPDEERIIRTAGRQIGGLRVHFHRRNDKRKWCRRKVGGAADLYRAGTTLLILAGFIP